MREGKESEGLERGEKGKGGKGGRRFQSVVEIRAAGTSHERNDKVGVCDKELRWWWWWW